MVWRSTGRHIARSVSVPLKFRHRIGLLVALAAAALVTVAAVTLVLGRRGARQLAGLEARYVRPIELDRDLERRQLASAFASARASQQDAIWIDIGVAGGALLLIGLLSRRLIRYTVRPLQAVASGVERLARGELEHEIEVMTRDELGDLAREANRTAVRLREYRALAARHDAELRDAYATLETRNATLVAAQQLLEEGAADVARASRYKTEFLANMSHELRTPLNSIMILSRVLAENPDGGLTDKQVEFATLINKSGDELLALINEVLDLAKVEAGKQSLTWGSLPLAELQDYIRRMFAPLAMQKDLAFVVEAAAELPAEIRTDRARLAQILKNLIANAFKFTERGRIVVRLSRELPGRTVPGDELAIADPIVITVSDTGIGIAADQQAWIFQAFAQAETGISRTYGGTGLGLTIAKQLAIRLGGDLLVESTPAVGSKFSLVLPIAGPLVTDGSAPRRGVAVPLLPPMTERGSGHREPTTPPPPQAPGEPAGDQPTLDGKTVMIVDDDMRNVYSLSSALQGNRVQVISAADGQEALEELERNPQVDIVLMDVMMPRMDGYEATRRIRAHDRFRELPIIALTARTMQGEREKCLAAGANAYVAKPVDFPELLALLRDWVG